MRTQSFLSVLILSSTVAAITEHNVTQAYHQLQTWYNQSTGLWIPSTGWWNSANCLTVIANLAKLPLDLIVHDEANDVWHTTYVNAQKYDFGVQKTVAPTTFLIESSERAREPRPAKGFLDDYYDDEGWWALAWIAVYDTTGFHKYLNTSEHIFRDMADAYGNTPCGGLWWDKAHTYVNAIANELFLSVAAHLANRVPSRSAYYLRWAERQWHWFKNSGMINTENTINDGLNDTTCQNNGGTVWSYNQGVILGGLTELARATNDTSYIGEAKRIADAAIHNLTDSNGILHDVCEPDCGADGSQFKGILMRNLQVLQQYSPEVRYANFIENNANSIWANDREGHELSLIWSGPYVQPANASTQSSAMDALVAALAVAKKRHS